MDMNCWPAAIGHSLSAEKLQKRKLENSSVSKQSAKKVIDELGDLFNFPCEEICNNK